jgi:hypothetical protein
MTSRTTEAGTPGRGRARRSAAAWRKSRRRVPFPHRPDPLAPVHSLELRLGDLADDRVVEHLALRQPAPRLGDDPAVGVLARRPAAWLVHLELVEAGLERAVAES